VKKPPSRVRYEKSHPIVSARLRMNHYKKLKKILETEEKRFAQFVRDAIDKSETEYSNAYELGYYNGTEDSEIWFYCSICGEKMPIIPNSESHKALLQYMDEHDWGHISCQEARERDVQKKYSNGTEACMQMRAREVISQITRLALFLH